jgi:cadmium resistance protein CadD (predicted permease)
LGLAPIAIGLKKLIEWKKASQPDAPQSGAESILTISTITFANGGDNIAVYVPLFASSNASGLKLILLVFGVMIGVWCVVGYFIGKHPLVIRLVDRYGHILVPFVLIALGFYILFR